MSPVEYSNRAQNGRCTASWGRVCRARCVAIVVSRCNVQYVNVYQYHYIISHMDMLMLKYHEYACIYKNMKSEVDDNIDNLIDNVYIIKNNLIRPNGSQFRVLC